MTETPLDRIVKRTSKALRLPEEFKLPKKKERAKKPKDDLGEKNWNKQIDEILTGNKSEVKSEKEKIRNQQEKA